MSDKIDRLLSAVKLSTAVEPHQIDQLESCVWARIEANRRASSLDTFDGRFTRLFFFRQGFVPVACAGFLGVMLAVTSVDSFTQLSSGVSAEQALNFKVFKPANSTLVTLFERGKVMNTP